MKRDQHKVQVWNDHDFQWVETFKGDTVTIPAKGFKEFEFYEAYEFRGQMNPGAMTLLADETTDPRKEKRIRCIEDSYQKAMSDGDESFEQEVFQCNAKGCKKSFLTEAKLLAHSESAHADLVVVDPDAEKALPKKRGPGRPSKSESVTA